jgi:hypothetical protein
MKTSPESKEELKQIFQLAYQKDLLLHFRTNPVDSDTAMELVDIIGGYNNFEPAKIKDVMRAFRGKVTGYEVGREYSPVIYVVLPYWTHQREYWEKLEMGERILDEELEGLKAGLKVAFRLACADEIQEVSPSVIRFWWD